MALNNVRLLKDADIKEGDLWLYCADFNVLSKGAIKSTDRIDIEVKDLEHIVSKGGIPLILAHQGRYKDGDSVDLDLIAPYLSGKLGSVALYCHDNTGDKAVSFVGTLKPGQAAIMGNTRFHEGDEKNSPELAKQFAELAGPGGRAAIGGFGKAHRAHASNVGILDYLPGYLAESQREEMELLLPWAGKSRVYSIAVLGGLKGEKITEGLVGFADAYDAIIPGGIVLNTIYKVMGKEIGDSVIEDGGKTFEKQVQDVLDKHYKKIMLPNKVVIAKKDNFEEHSQIRIDEGVPADYMIVDFSLPTSAYIALERVEKEHGRVVLAGTPGIYTKGFKKATDPIVDCMHKSSVQAIALGGDTVKEVRFNGPSSTGGGSALYYLGHGTTLVYDALKANMERGR